MPKKRFEKICVTYTRHIDGKKTQVGYYEQEEPWIGDMEVLFFKLIQTFHQVKGENEMLYEEMFKPAEVKK